MKLHCFKGDHRAAKVLTIMNAVEMPCQIEFLNPDTYSTDENFKALSPLGKTPVLESDFGPLYETNTILRYIARKKKDKGYAGILPREESQIDQWLEYASNELDPVLMSIYDSLNNEDTNEKYKN